MTEKKKPDMSLERLVAERTEELRQSIELAQAERQRFNNVLDQLPAYLVLLTADYHVRFANRFFEERFGKSKGRRCYEHLFNRTDPCPDCETYTVLKTNAPHHWYWRGPDGCDYDIYDFPFVDIDGSQLIMEVGLDITQRKKVELELAKYRENLESVVKERTSELQSANEKLRASRTAALNLMEDAVRARKQVEESTRALKASEEKFRTLFETMVEGFALHEIILNETGKAVDYRFLEMNPAFERLTGLKRAELVGKRVKEAIPGIEQSWIDNYGNVVLTGRPITFESYSGSLGRWYSASAYRTGPGQFAVVFVDITERKTSEDKMHDLNVVLEQRVAERTDEVQKLADQLRALAAELSHAEQRERKRLALILHDHIQQLLVSAQMQVSLVKRADPKMVQSIAQGIESTIREAISASRSLTAELSPPILHQSGLAAALHWLANRMEEQHFFKIHVHADAAAEPASPETRTLLFESVRELLLNSIKHSKRHEATVHMRRGKDNRALITVEDDGEGFDPSSIKPGGSGGFGLFSIQQRLMYMGGNMEIASSPGKGTRATLTVPIGKADAGSIGGPHATAIAFREKHGKIRIMLVDDHKIVRQGLAGLLQMESSDMEVVGEAENGKVAIEMALARKPDVIVMDVNMPVMDGIEATKILKKQMPNVSIIGLSMHPERDAAEAMRQAGAAAYLTKGGPSVDLIATIHACANAVS